MSRRAAIIVLDGVGIGRAHDTDAYGDTGSDTLGNLARQCGGLDLPRLTALGLGHCGAIAGVPAVASPTAAHGSCEPVSAGKDSTTGHWEICGLLLSTAFPTYPDGFPQAVIDDFSRLTGRGVLGNIAASGTAVLDRFGEEHRRSGKWIVYTSADSVFQIAAHEEVIPLWELYKICEIAREILRGPHEVGRVIARPFLGSPGSFVRTANRHDYAVPPPPGMLLDRLEERGVPIHGVGKISDVFLGRGIGESDKSKNNADGMAKTLEAMNTSPKGLIFVNLVDFDTTYGHRNDVEGYGAALEQFDAWVPDLERALTILTADHGCDPTVPGTDHTREYVPVLAFGPQVRAGVSIGKRTTLSDIGQTVAANFETSIAQGTSFLSQIL
jgi:phosphopentomutase